MKFARTLSAVAWLCACGADTESPPRERNSCEPDHGVAKTSFYQESGDCPAQSDGVFSLDPRSTRTTTPGFSELKITSSYNDGCEAFNEGTTTLTSGAHKCDAKITQTTDWTPATKPPVFNSAGELVLATGLCSLAIQCDDGSYCNGVYKTVFVKAN